ncbi:hypothetical protein LT85_4016 [Collimonas arenae]|uniref:Uncharacterized protein n=1 Tax=Collimonas arenae TaxID=279058 RepID=A0A0A1FHR6_9BURK|nr:hypothetical protein LT85_4016 [Collimonas arenae]
MDNESSGDGAAAGGGVLAALAAAVAAWAGTPFASSKQNSNSAPLSKRTKCWKELVFMSAG